MSDEYTPTTKQILMHYIASVGGYDERDWALSEARFERWLAAHDAEVKAEYETMLAGSHAREMVQLDRSRNEFNRAQSSLMRRVDLAMENARLRKKISEAAPNE